MSYQFFLSLIFVLWFSPIADNKNGMKFKVRLQEVGDCRTREFKKSNDEPMKYSYKLNVYGANTYFDVNYTVTRKFGPVAMTIRMYQLYANDQQKLIYKLDRMTCKSLLTQQFIRYNNISVDKDCNAIPGTVPLVNQTMDKIGWLWTRGANNRGRYVYEVEYSCRDTSVGCVRLVTEIYQKK